MLNDSCYEFINKLGTSSPTPGGGSAAALAAAAAASLGSMAAALSKGKKSVAQYWQRIDDLSVRAQELSLLGCEAANQDAEAFLPLSKAYGIRAVTPEEKAQKAAVLEHGLINAAKAPSELLNVCFEISLVLRELAGICTKLSVSDAACGASLCEAAAECAYFNVLANTRLMQDRAAAQSMNDDHAKLLSSCRQNCRAAVGAALEVL